MIYKKEKKICFESKHVIDHALHGKRVFPIAHGMHDKRVLAINHGMNCKRVFKNGNG